MRASIPEGLRPAACSLYNLGVAGVRRFPPARTLAIPVGRGNQAFRARCAIANRILGVPAPEGRCGTHCVMTRSLLWLISAWRRRCVNGFLAGGQSSDMAVPPSASFATHSSQANGGPKPSSCGCTRHAGGPGFSSWWHLRYRNARRCSDSRRIVNSRMNSLKARDLYRQSSQKSRMRRIDSPSTRPPHIRA